MTWLEKISSQTLYRERSQNFTGRLPNNFYVFFKIFKLRSFSYFNNQAKLKALFVSLTLEQPSIL